MTPSFILHIEPKLNNSLSYSQEKNISRGQKEIDLREYQIWFQKY